jgi:hypothetical protein
VIIGAGSLYALDLHTGAVRFQVGFPGKAFHAVTIARQRIVAVLGPDFRVTPHASAWKYELILIDGRREIARRPLKGLGAVRTCTETGLVYVTGTFSTEVIDPSTGKIVGSFRQRIALPDTFGGLLYALTDEGVLFAAPAFTRRALTRSGHRVC